MDKQKQIEEMASIICKETSNKGVCENCAFKKHTQFGFVYQCSKFDNAENLYNAGYRKIPENAVVLTREEYDDMFTFKTVGSGGKHCGFYNILDTVRKVERKETAEIYKNFMILSIAEMLKYGEIDSEQADILYHHNYQIYKGFSEEVQMDKQVEDIQIDEQVVKNTAKEIFTDLLKEFSIRKSCGNADVVVREMAQRKGVEVE